jgi:hypothetical protein
VLGKTFTVGNASLTIIGVASPGFIGETSGQQPDLWLPLRVQPRVLPGNDWLHDTARQGDVASRVWKTETGRVVANDRFHIQERLASPRSSSASANL